MSRRRRVEITTFRRRVTIVLRDKCELSPMERPSGAARLEVLDLGRSQTAHRNDAARAGRKRDRLRLKLRSLMDWSTRKNIFPDALEVCCGFLAYVSNRGIANEEGKDGKHPNEIN